MKSLKASNDNPLAWHIFLLHKVTYGKRGKPDIQDLYSKVMRVANIQV